jgi:ribonuclease D
MIPPDCTYIASQTALRAFVDSIRGATLLAVDTEFIGEKYYYPRLELLQISDGTRTGLVDVPATGSLDLLRPILTDPAVTKIFHAAGTDMPILAAALGTAVTPIFDTQVAAAMLGYGAQISLANLVRIAFGIEVKSGQTTSDWSARPLNDAQLTYAAEDVAHLHALHARLLGELQAAGRLEWYADEQARRVVDALATNDDQDDETLYRKVKDWMSLPPKDLVVLRELAIWREHRARDTNQPRRLVFTDEGLVEFAKFQPRTIDAARKLRKVHQGQIGRYFDELVGVVDRAKRIPKEQWPDRGGGERVEIPTGLVELCQALLRTEAEAQKLAPTMLATSADLQRLLARSIAEPGTEPDIPLLQGWRRQVAGDRLLALLNGQLVARVDRERGIVFEDYRGK